MGACFFYSYLRQPLSPCDGFRFTQIERKGEFVSLPLTRMQALDAKSKKTHSGTKPPPTLTL